VNVGDEGAFFEPGADEAGFGGGAGFDGVGGLEFELEWFWGVGEVEDEGCAGDDAALGDGVVGRGGAENVGALDGDQFVCFAFWGNVEFEDFDAFDFGDAVGIESFGAVAESGEVDV
jgi:hypothetical protein